MIRALLLGGLLLAGPAQADPADALPELLRGAYVEGLRLEEEQRYEEAAARFRFVLRGDPGFTHAVVDLGRVLEAAEDDGAAEVAYAQEPYDPDAVEALALLYLRQERFAEAEAQLHRLTDLRLGWPRAHLLLARAQAGLDPLQAEESFRAFMEMEGAALDEETAGVAVAVHDALREEHPDEAGALLEDLVATWPEAEGAEAIEERLILARVEEEARLLMTASGRPLPSDQRAALERARTLHASAEHDQAAEVLAGILATSPRSAAAWGALSEVREAQGDVAEAERAARMALALAPMDPAWHARMGDLLVRWYGGRYDAEALAHYERALQFNPAWDEVLAKQARLARHLGDPTQARQAWGRYLAIAPEGAHAQEARNEVTGFVRARPDAPTPPRPDARPADVPEQAWERFHLAWAWANRGEYEHAHEELAQVRATAPAFARALNLEASIRLEQGQEERALDLYARSLDLQPDQPRVYEVLLKLHQGDGAATRALLERATAAGAGDAWLILAREAVSAGRYGEALAHLDHYFASDRSGDLDAEARELRERAQEGRRGWLRLGLGLAGALGLGGVALWWRRRRGVGLQVLLDRVPEAWPDVARTASAIRHEVLKHNTTLLEAVAASLEEGDGEPAAWAADKLYGERGALTRLREHVSRLERLGRRHGLRLDLRRRDPVFAPILAAADRLQRLQGDLRRGSGRRLSVELRLVSVALNQEGYRALGRLIRSAYLLPVEEALLQGVWEAVRSEPAFREAPPVRLCLDLPAGEAPVLRIYRGELEDLLANLLRNSLQATLEAGEEELGLRVECEEDLITGLERVALRVVDHAPRTLSTALIRSRYVERGLGLTVDLISRAGGSISVEDEPGWTKAVVVRLPRAEVPEEEEA